MAGLSQHGNATCLDSPIRQIKVSCQNDTQLRSDGDAIALICKTNRTPIATDRTPIALFCPQNRTRIAPDRTPIALPTAFSYIQVRTVRKK